MATNSNASDLAPIPEMASNNCVGPAFTIAPVPKKDSDDLGVYLTYFERVSKANGWGDETAAVIFPGLLELGSKALDDLDEKDLKSFKVIKRKLMPEIIVFREARVQEFFGAKMNENESVLAFSERCKAVVSQCYPSFAAANRQLLTRDRFVHGLPRYLKSAVLNCSENKKLDNAIQAALMAEGVKETLRREADPPTPRPRDAGETKARREIKCFKCHKAGHLANACPLKAARVSTVRGANVVHCNVDGCSTAIKIDTGADVSILPANHYLPTQRKKLLFQAANGEPLVISGTRQVELTLGKWCGKHVFYIGEVAEPLLGIDFLSKHGATVDASTSPIRVHFPEPTVATVDDDSMSSNDEEGLESIVASAVQPYVVGQDLFNANAPDTKSESKMSLTIVGKWVKLFEGLGRTHVVEHHIDTGTASPIRLPSYRVPHHLLEKARDQVQQMIRDGVVEKSSSEWSSPIILIRKSSGDIRVVIDFRKLNNVSKKDAYPMPRIDNLLDSLGGSSVFSTLDCKSGYYQIPLTPESKEKTAFSFEGELYHFNCLPFGLSSAPATFSRMMSKLLANVPNVVWFLDDICVHSPTIEQHTVDLERVLRVLEDAGLTLNKEKCTFYQKRIKFLGYSVENGTVSPLKEKVAAIQKYPTPGNLKQLKRFCGLIGYYRSLIPGFSVIAVPLYRLLAKDVKFEWREIQQSAFEKLKAALSSGVLRNMPDLSLPFKVRVDASGDGVGCVLLQERGNRESLIECASKKFSETERRYPIIEQEAFAIMFALERWQHFLLGKPFSIETDHKPLVWLKSKKDCRGKLGRWAMRLCEFDFSVTHVKGESNVDADSLSRAPVDAVVLSDLVECQRRDEQLLELRQQGVAMKQDGDLWYYCEGEQRRLYLPKSYRNFVWDELHNKLGHLGQQKCRELISARYYWPRLRCDVKTWVKRCGICAVNKDFPPASAPVPMVAVDASGLEPNEKVSVDVMGPLKMDNAGFKYLIVSCDYLTRWVDAKPVKSLGAEQMIAWLREFSSRYGVPRELVSDRGPDMESKAFKEFCASIGTRQVFIAPYHHQSNLVERSNRSILNILRTSIAENQSNWLEQLPIALLAYRSSVHSSLGVSPSKALYGYDLRLPVDLLLPSDASSPVGLQELNQRLANVRRGVREKQAKAASERALSYDKQKRAVTRSFSKGDKVYWKNMGTKKKLDKCWLGPFEIVTQLSEANYKIRGSSNTTKTVHVNQLKKCDTIEPLSILRGRGRPRTPRTPEFFG